MRPERTEDATSPSGWAAPAQEHDPPFLFVRNPRFDSRDREGSMRQVMDPADIDRALRRVGHEIIEHNKGTGDLLLLGIHTRGVPLAKRLAVVLADIEGSPVDVGSIDVGLYRDDLDTRPRTRIGPTELPDEPDGRTVVLVDDVLYTGRTIRSALDALADLGRPARVQLAVLTDRGHRELPIRADYVGRNLPTASSERVTVRLVEIDEEDGVYIEDQEES